MKSSRQTQALRVPAFHPDVRRSELYAIRVNGRPLEVLATDWADFAPFSFSGSVAVEVLAKEPVESVVIRPKSRGVSGRVEDGRISFSLDAPDNFWIDIPGKKTLFLYANPLETAAPSPGDPNVRYFSSGQIHETGVLEVSSGQTVYLEDGAVLKGCIHVKEAHDVAIAGYGVIDGGFFSKGAPGRKRTVLFDQCRNVSVRDICVINPSSWTVQLTGCHDSRVSNIKEIGDGGGSDGIDICACRDITVEGCMLRNGDDALVVKSFGGDVENIGFTRCSIVNVGGGSAMEIGHELRADHVRNIAFRDCDVLCKHGYGAIFSINDSDRASIENIRYEDIRVEHYYNCLISLRIRESMWCRDAQRGHVRNIHFKNISIINTQFNAGYSKSLIGGRDREHKIENVTIENLTIDGKKITDHDELDLYVKQADGIVFM